jgi:RimJ/RimL family protein N-acetyltransferase
VTDQVVLRPVTEEDLDHLERMFANPEAMGEFLWDGWHDTRVWRRRWEDNRLLGGDRYVLIVIAGEERAGFVSWRPIEPGTPFQYWEIGISLWPRSRGHGYGTEAQRQVVRYLFAHTRANRIQALTDVANLAEQRSLEKAGFTREGVLRGYAFRADRWHDEVIYSVLRSEVPLD